jgi:transglutaminase-like putative cysteine protease
MSDRGPTVAPFALAACLAFWGWQAGQLPLAIAFAALLESHRLVRWRWQLGERDFQRIADISSVIFVALVVVQFNNDLIGGIFQVLKWLPVVLVPLLIAQRYGQTDGVPLSALFASVRRRRSIYDTPAGTIDLQPYFALCCLIAASVGAEHGPAFAPMALALLSWVLMGTRLIGLRGRARIVALAALLAATGIGLALRTGLYATQSWVEDAALRWMRDPMFSGASPDRAFTAIGMIGRLKLSDRIRLRVATDRPLTAPLLLHEASYGEYRYASWRNAGAELIAVDPLPDGRTWQLAPAGPVTQRATITVPLREDTSVIPLPMATRTLRSSEILGIQRNRFGAVVADARAGFVRYEAQYGGNDTVEDRPTAEDRVVPAAYRAALDAVTKEMALPPSPDQAAIISALEQFFADHFEYSLVQRGRWAFTQPLNTFLLERRRGHCEYFATATVLLLRHLGIPARYAVGYAISEYSWLDRQYVARQRDAHAWALAFVDGRWQPVDTTPATWRAAEDGTASAFAGVFDIAAWLSYQWSRWQAGGQGVRTLLPWLLPPLVGWLLWRLRGARRQSTPLPSTPPAPTRVGTDSELLLVVRSLGERGYPIAPGTTLSHWRGRLPAVWREGIDDLLDLHYRHRFDPSGLSDTERRRLRDGALQLLEVIRHGSPRMAAATQRP